MNLSKKGSPASEIQQNSANKGTTLNPHAAEFIPFALRVAPGTISNPDVVAEVPCSVSLGKQALDQSGSSVLTNSDEEARQYWQRQLPDDITPDFKILGDMEPEGIGSLSVSGLSLHDGDELELAPHHANGAAFVDKIRYPLPSHEVDSPPANSFHVPAKPWEKHVMSSDYLLGSGSFEENNTHGYTNDMVSENATLENSDMNTLQFLVAKFPGFAADSVAEVYFANCCDMQLTIEMLTQLEVWANPSLVVHLLTEGGGLHLSSMKISSFG
ncbi:hypothetical protein Ancab_007149 [Ancistrocladus abbreviatus]